MDFGQEINPREVGETVALSVTLLAAGGFLGIEYTAKTVLAHQEALAPTPAWLDVVEPARYALLVVVVVGFAAMLCLDYFES